MDKVENIHLLEVTIKTGESSNGCIIRVFTRKSICSNAVVKYPHQEKYLSKKGETVPL